MAKLWLTYAWKDNEDDDVDHVIAELKAHGLDVRYDRVQLLAGRRLWEQIDAEINDPDVSAWAMFVTENSLKSEPCQEEIAYALDRTLRTRGGSFPLIGIFPKPPDESIIPSAIATRLYVNLRDPQWAERVAASVAGQPMPVATTPPLPYGYTLHTTHGMPLLEVWPRSGRWYPFVALVPSREVSKLKFVLHGPKGGLTGMVAVSGADVASDNGELKGCMIHHAIDLLHSAYIRFEELPSRVEFGELNSTPLFKMVFG